jgi:hypothetical protein
MDVEMEHDLAAIGAVVGDQAIAVLLQRAKTLLRS